MAQSYSSDLRDRIVDYVESGHSRREVARRFGVSASFAVKLLQRYHSTGSAKPALRGRPSGKGKLSAHRDFLIDRVEAKPDITMPELADALQRRRGVMAAPASLSRLLCRAGYTYKKTLMASEQERSDVKAKRVFWIKRRRPLMALQPHRLVFLDETSVNTKMTRLRGRSLRGTRLAAQAPYGHWKTQTFIAGLRCHGLIAPWIIDAPMNRKTFNVYVETQLAP